LDEVDEPRARTDHGEEEHDLPDVDGPSSSRFCSCLYLFVRLAFLRVFTEHSNERADHARQQVRNGARQAEELQQQALLCVH
jgi:hypothetical protein